MEPRAYCCGGTGHGTFSQGQVFVNLEDTSQTLAIDAQSLKVKSRWSLAPGEGPTGLAIDRKHHLLFAVCGNAKMVVLNTNTGQVVTAVSIGKGADATVPTHTTTNVRFKRWSVVPGNSNV